MQGYLIPSGPGLLMGELTPVSVMHSRFVPAKELSAVQSVTQFVHDAW
jgi:hypothetical protein